MFMYRSDEEPDPFMYVLHNPAGARLQDMLDQRSRFFLWAFLAAEVLEAALDHDRQLSAAYRVLQEGRSIYGQSDGEEVQRRWESLPRVRVTILPLEIRVFLLAMYEESLPVSFSLGRSGEVEAKSEIPGWSPAFTRDPRSVNEAREMARAKARSVVARLATKQFELFPDLKPRS